MEYLQSIADFVLHIDQHLIEIVSNYQTWTYLLLFLIVFAETGFVVTPFLPGDSLLFAAGAVIAHQASELNIALMAVILIVAAILGDWVNYHVGRYLGPKVFSGKYRLFQQSHLWKAQSFYYKYGGKAIIYARFVPVLRTFSPFVAGIAHMKYSKFASYNVAGGILWVGSFLMLGYFFGNLTWIRENFSIVILAIILISVLPPILEGYIGKKKQLRTISRS
ncbi:DedA family protein [Catalinimonas sp. 4WD22]|uniref:DedA family protein n=1 Tax=Catalinimonas locisalis TaxID=3133978 RepID=UPI003100D112